MICIISDTPHIGEAIAQVQLLVHGSVLLDATESSNSSRIIRQAALFSFLLFPIDV